MNKARIIYHDRVLRITLFLSEGKRRYRIEVTNGLISRSWDEFVAGDEEALRIAMEKLGKLGGKEKEHDNDH